MTIAIFGNSHHEKIEFYLAQVLDFFKETEDVSFILEQKLFTLFEKEISNFRNKIIPHSGNDFSADFAISLGGDGTFLKTAQQIADKQIPILGINIGRLGFLAETSENDIAQALKNIVLGNYITEERSLLQAVITPETTLERQFALNEIAVLKRDSAAMINIHTSFNGEPAHTYHADGLIVATPTGSTAYSLSVGGPIVVPQAQSIVLSPVATHSLTVRPLIIPDTWTVELDVSSRRNTFNILVDGRSKTLEDGTKICISKAPFTIKIIKQKDYTFFDTLQNKLMWGMDKRIES